MFKTIRKLSNTVIRKFVDCIKVENLEVESDTGWTKVDYINKTIPYKVFTVTTESGNIVKCADDHIFIDENYNEIFAKDCLNVNLKTNYGIGLDRVVSVTGSDIEENMYDLSLAEDSDKLFYSNGILSHNSTLMTIVALWTALFFENQTIAILAQKEATAIEIFGRVRIAYMELDNWLKGGIEEFAKTFLKLANGSRIVTSATSPDAIRGSSVDVLLLDEFAIIPPKVAEEFWTAVTPTLATRFAHNKNAKLIVASTPKGVGNKFHELVTRAEEGKNDFCVQRAMWYDFPGRDEAWRQEQLLTFTPDAFEQEFACRFLDNSGSPFDLAMFEKFKEEMIDPINILDDGNYLIWKEPQEDRIYAMGVDTAEGVGEDFSVMQIFDITDPLQIEQVARYSTNTMDTTTWSGKVNQVAKQWFSPILLIERNGAGTTPCDRLFNDMHYPRFINYGTKEAGKLRAGRSFRSGIINTSNTKNAAVTNMKYYANDRKVLKLYDHVTIDELKTFMRVKSASGNYQWKAQKGFHDDHVIAMVWGLFALHRHVIDTWLEIVETTEEGIPITIKKKWVFNAERDFENSLYKNISNKTSSPFVGVVVFKDSIVHDPRMGRKNTDDRFTNLLDHGAQMSLEEYYEHANIPQSFR